MARIPMGNFGNAMPQVERIRMPQDQTGEMLAGALGNIGGVARAQAEDQNKKQIEQELAQKQLIEANDKRAQQEAKVKVDEVLTTEASEQVTLLKNDLANGRLTADQARTQWNEWNTKRFEELKPEIPYFAHQDFQKYWKSQSDNQTQSFLPLQLQADTQKDYQLLERATTIATRLPPDQRDQYLESYLTNANIPEAKKTEYRTKLKTDSDALNIEDRILTSVEASDITSLQAISTDLDNGKYAYIDGPKAQQYKASISSKIATIQNRIEIEGKKREGEAQKTLNDFVQNVLTGRELDPEYVGNVGTAIKGTTLEGEYQFYVSQSKNFQEFSKLSTADQDKKISQMKAQMKNNPSADPTSEQKILNVYERIKTEKINTLKNDPKSALLQSGIKLPELNPADLKINPAEAAKSMAEIGSYQLAQRKKDPNAKIKVISDAELNGMKQSFDGMNVDQKLNFIGSLLESTKGIQGGNDIWRSTLWQLGSGDASYTMAGIARMNGYKSTQGEDVATAIVSGTQLLKNKQMVMPSDDTLRTEFGKYVGQSVTGESASMTFAAFKSIYAHLSVRDGYQHKDNKDYSKEVLNTALGLATGGVYDQGDFKNVNGGSIKNWKVAKPYGMTDDRFEAVVDKRIQTLTQKYKVPESELRDLRITRTAQRGANNVLRYALVNERGKPLYYFNMPEGVTK